MSETLCSFCFDCGEELEASELQFHKCSDADDEFEEEANVCLGLSEQTFDDENKNSLRNEIQLHVVKHMFDNEANNSIKTDKSDQNTAEFDKCKSNESSIEIEIFANQLTKNVQTNVYDSSIKVEPDSNQQMESGLVDGKRLLSEREDRFNVLLTYLSLKRSAEEGTISIEADQNNKPKDKDTNIDHNKQITVGDDRNLHSISDLISNQFTNKSSVETSTDGIQLDLEADKLVNSELHKESQEKMNKSNELNKLNFKRKQMDDRPISHDSEIRLQVTKQVTPNRYRAEKCNSTKGQNVSDTYNFDQNQLKLATTCFSEKRFEEAPDSLNRNEKTHEIELMRTDNISINLSRDSNEDAICGVKSSYGDDIDNHECNITDVSIKQNSIPDSLPNNINNGESTSAVVENSTEEFLHCFESQKKTVDTSDGASENPILRTENLESSYNSNIKQNRRTEIENSENKSKLVDKPRTEIDTSKSSINSQKEFNGDVVVDVCGPRGKMENENTRRGEIISKNKNSTNRLVIADSSTDSKTSRHVSLNGNIVNDSGTFKDNDQTSSQVMVQSKNSNTRCNRRKEKRYFNSLFKYLKLEKRKFNKYEIVVESSREPRNIHVNRDQRTINRPKEMVSMNKNDMKLIFKKRHMGESDLIAKNTDTTEVIKKTKRKKRKRNNSEDGYFRQAQKRFRNPGKTDAEYSNAIKNKNGDGYPDNIKKEQASKENTQIDLVRVNPDGSKEIQKNKSKGLNLEDLIMKNNKELVDRSSDHRSSRKPDKTDNTHEHLGRSACLMAESSVFENNTQTSTPVLSATKLLEICSPKIKTDRPSLQDCDMPRRQRVTPFDQTQQKKPLSSRSLCSANGMDNIPFASHSVVEKSEHKNKYQISSRRRKYSDASNNISDPRLEYIDKEQDLVGLVGRHHNERHTYDSIEKILEEMNGSESDSESVQKKSLTSANCNNKSGELEPKYDCKKNENNVNEKYNYSKEYKTTNRESKSSSHEAKYIRTKGQAENETHISYKINRERVRYNHPYSSRKKTISTLQNKSSNDFDLNKSGLGKYGRKEKENIFNIEFVDEAYNKDANSSNDDIFTLKEKKHVSANVDDKYLNLQHEKFKNKNSIHVTSNLSINSKENAYPNNATDAREKTSSNLSRYHKTKGITSSNDLQNQFSKLEMEKAICDDVTCHESSCSIRQNKDDPNCPYPSSMIGVNEKDNSPNTKGILQKCYNKQFVTKADTNKQFRFKPSCLLKAKIPSVQNRTRTNNCDTNFKDESHKPKKVISIEQYRQKRLSRNSREETPIANDPLHTITMDVPPLSSKRSDVNVESTSEYENDLFCQEAAFSDDDTSHDGLSQEKTAVARFCEACGFQADNPDDLSNHMTQMHLGFNFKCFVCNISYTNLDSLISHVKKYPSSVLLSSESQFLRQRKSVPNQPYPYYCSLCGTGFTLMRHITMHKDDTSVCFNKANGKLKVANSNEKCRVEENDLPSITYEMSKSCNEERRVEVNDDSSKNDDDPNEVVFKSTDLKKSGSSHDKNPNTISAIFERPVSPFLEFCELCGKKQTSLEERQQHFHIYSFECLICRLTYPKLNDLIRHYYSCHSRHEINQHEMTESVIKNRYLYYCSICGKGLQFIDELVEHKMREHVKNIDEEVAEANANLGKYFARPRHIPGLDDASSESENENNTETVPLPPQVIDRPDIIDLSQVSESLGDSIELIQSRNEDGESSQKDESNYFVEIPEFFKDKHISSDESDENIFQDEYSGLSVVEEFEECAVEETNEDLNETESSPDRVPQPPQSNIQNDPSTSSNNLDSEEVSSLTQHRQTLSNKRPETRTLNRISNTNIRCPVCGQRFDFWFQLNEHRVKYFHSVISAREKPQSKLEQLAPVELSTAESSKQSAAIKCLVCHNKTFSSMDDFEEHRNTSTEHINLSPKEHDFVIIEQLATLPPSKDLTQDSKTSSTQTFTGEISKEFSISSTINGDILYKNSSKTSVSTPTEHIISRPIIFPPKFFNDSSSTSKTESFIIDLSSNSSREGIGFYDAVGQLSTKSHTSTKSNDGARKRSFISSSGRSRKKKRRYSTKERRYRSKYSKKRKHKSEDREGFKRRKPSSSNGDNEFGNGSELRSDNINPNSFDGIWSWRDILSSLGKDTSANSKSDTKESQ